MQFLIDAAVGRTVARRLNDMGHSAVHVMDIGLDRAPDDAIVAHARAEARVIITTDLDFPRLIALSGHAGPGLILLRDEGRACEQTLATLERVFSKVSPSELASSIVVAEAGRIRSRMLPI